MATSEYGQSLINICESYSREWAFKFSPAKSNVFSYSKRRKHITCNRTLYEDSNPIISVMACKQERPMFSNKSQTLYLN